MTFHFTEPGIIFALLLAFYICLQCALSMIEVSRAERNASHVPEPFEKTVSLAEHRKAVDYHVELIQCDLVNALVGAVLAVLFTFAGGLNWLLDSIEQVWGQKLFTQFLLVVTVTALLVLIDLPFCWVREFRVNERYGFERAPQKQWLRSALIATLIGWFCEIPLLVLFIILLKVSSYNWWLAASAICAVWFFWIWIAGPTWRMTPGKKATLMPRGELRSIIERRLFREGFIGCEILSAKGPNGGRRDCGILTGRPGKMKFVLYDFVSERLKEPEQLDAIVALVIARRRLHHNTIRFVLASAFMLVFWLLLAMAFTFPPFYEALGMSAEVALRNGKPLAGLVISLMLIAAPILLYPLVFPIHYLNRRLDFEADRWAVARAGSKPFVEALVNLERDIRCTVEPSAPYGLANHRHPHVMQRINATLNLDSAQQMTRFTKLLEARSDLAIPKSILTNTRGTYHG
jgi:STE24 endopeptidase